MHGLLTGWGYDSRKPQIDENAKILDKYGNNPMAVQRHFVKHVEECLSCKKFYEEFYEGIRNVCKLFSLGKSRKPGGIMRERRINALVEIITREKRGGDFIEQDSYKKPS